MGVLTIDVARDRMTAMFPMYRLGQPKEIGAAVAFL